jgi:two-component system response regulator LytT
MNILIIEDENLAAQRLEKLVKEIDTTIAIKGITDSIDSSVEWLQSNPVPDLILMDIELADGQSFEIFTRVEVKSPVIFTTAYDEFALKAFKVNSIDYLLKPVKSDDLKNSLQKLKSLKDTTVKLDGMQNIKHLLEGLYQQNQEQFRTRFLAKAGQRFVPIDTEEIAYFYSEDKMVFLKTRSNQRYLLDFNLEQLEKELDPKAFFRANRQFILSNKSILDIHSWFNGKLKVKVNPATTEEVIISRDKASEFKTWMGE